MTQQKTGDNRHYIKRSFQKYFFKNISSNLYSYKRNDKFKKNLTGSIISKNPDKMFKNTGAQNNSKKYNISLDDENDNNFTKKQEVIEDNIIKRLNNESSFGNEDYIFFLEKMFFPCFIRSINKFKEIFISDRNKDAIKDDMEIVLKKIYNKIYKKLHKQAEIGKRFKNVDIITFDKVMYLSDIVLFNMDKNYNLSFLKSKTMIYDNICVQLNCHTLLIFNNGKKYKKLNKKILLDKINNFLINGFSDFLITDTKTVNVNKKLKNKKIDSLYDTIEKFIDLNNPQ